MKKFVAITAVVVLAVVLATMLMACTPSEDSLRKKYEKEGYTVASIGADEADTDAEIKYAFIATKNIVETVTVICFANSDDAKKYYDEAKATIEKLGSIGNAMEAKKSGNAVAVGTAEAVKIF